MKKKIFLIISILILALFLNPLLFLSLVLGFIFVYSMIDMLFEDDTNIGDIEINDEMIDKLLTFGFMIVLFIFSVITFFNLFNIIFYGS